MVQVEINPHIPTRLEADATLRQTLTDLLKENEALRLALQASTTEAKCVEQSVPEIKPPPAALKIAKEIQIPSRSPSPAPAPPVVKRTARVLHTEARRIALERYRSKRARRIAKTPHLQGPKNMKYRKMKKAADAKRRNSEGKFIKKADLEKMRLAEEAAQHAMKQASALVEIPTYHQFLVQ